MSNKMQCKIRPSLYVPKNKQALTKVHALHDRNAYLKGYWYAIALSENISHDKPHKTSCFDRDIVLYRDKYTEKIIAQDNVCPHRGAPLDRGWLEHDAFDQTTAIACPYHGWVFDTHGKIARVPSLKCDCDRLPKRQVLPTYTDATHEEGGYVWFLYGGDAMCSSPIPTRDMDDLIQKERAIGVPWRPVYGEILFDAPHWNVFDNAIDITHIHYLHGDSFGNSSKPEIKDFEMLNEDDSAAHHVHMRFKIHNKPANLLWHWTIVDDVDVEMQIWLPYTSIIKISLGAGVQMITVVNTTPIDAHRSINRFCLWRNFAPWPVLDGFARQAMLNILGQDKDMVELLLRPQQVTKEISLRSDMPQIAYRKLRQKIANIFQRGQLTDQR